MRSLSIFPPPLAELAESPSLLGWDLVGCLRRME